MARWGRPCSYFRRRISRTCLISSLSVIAVGALLGGPRTGAPGYRRATRLGTSDHDPSERAIALGGTGDHDRSESVITMRRNGRSRSRGIRNNALRAIIPGRIRANKKIRGLDLFKATQHPTEGFLQPAMRSVEWDIETGIAELGRGILVEVNF